MTFDRENFKQSVEAQKIEKTRDQKTSLGMLQVAAVEAKFLTGDRNWDTYLTYIQSAIERTEAQLAGFKEALCDPDMTNADDLMRIKIHAATCTGRIEAFNAMRQLPTDLMNAGGKAKQLLDTIDENDARLQ